MKRIVAVFLAAAAICSFVPIAMAEGDVQVDKEKNIARTAARRSSAEKMMPAPDVQLRRLSRGLELTPEQQQQIRPMLVDEYDKLKAIRLDDNLTPKQIQGKVEALRTETIAKIQTVLTPAQKEKYDTVSKEIKANKKQRMQDNRRKRIGTEADPPLRQPGQ